MADQLAEWHFDGATDILYASFWQLRCIHCFDMRADAFTKDVPPPLGALLFPFRFAAPPAFLPFFLLLLVPAPLPSPSC